MNLRRVVWVMGILCALVMLSGCHSGTVRGMGSDVERMGEGMQR